MSTLSGKARAQKKVRRQKQFIAVGSVVLFALLGFEMTKVLSHGGGRQAAPPTPTTATSSSVAGSTTTSSSDWKLPDTDRVVVQRNTDQLLSFGLFSSKDPFVQQLAATPSPPASPAAVAPTPVTRSPRAPITTTPPRPVRLGLTPVTTTPAPSVPPSAATTSPAPAPAPAPAPPATTTSPSTPTAPETAPTSALISTNGVCEKVAVKGTFPGGADIFRVVSVARDGKSVEISVVGGSYDSGQATATLKVGEKLTLVNTGDGTRYVIQLKSKCAVLVQPSRAAGASPATITPSAVPAAPTTTTPTTTTPIVPDSLDTTTTPTN